MTPTCCRVSVPSRPDSLSLACPLRPTRRPPGACATLRSLLLKTGPVRWNEHIEGDGGTIFRHACKLGLEGIVSKRKDSPDRSGRSPDSLKMKTPEARRHPSAPPVLARPRA